MHTISFLTPVYVSIVVAEIFNQCQNADAVVWIIKPDVFTYGPQGTNISVRWNYGMESNEQFITSMINYKGTDLASRPQGEDYYGKYLSGPELPFTVSGSDDITLTIHNAQVAYNGKICCEVDSKSPEGKRKTNNCTTLFAYVLPSISYHTPDVSSKQDDMVRLYCNATGYPEPSGEWIDRKTNKAISNSFVASLKIAGKRSEGTFCCKATNQFGQQTKCTSVTVTEYQPVSTILSSTSPYVVKSRIFQLRCNADASPSPYYIFKRDNVQIHNSTDGKFISNSTITGGEAIRISCIPWNKYGSGPEKEIALPVYEPPRFTSDLRTSYNMTTKSINMTCMAKGVPKPSISWTKVGSDDVISNKDYYEVPFNQCCNKTLTFYCNARNKVGVARSPQIQVLIMTKGYPTERVTPFQAVTTGMDGKHLIFIVVFVPVAILLVVITLVLFRFCRMRKARLTELEESPYGEPIDAVPITVSGKIAEVGTTHDDQYATIEEVGYEKRNHRFFKRKKNKPENEEIPLQNQDDDPIYAVVKKDTSTNEIQ